MTSIPSNLPRTGSRRRRDLWSSAPGYIGLVLILFWIFAALTSQFWLPYAPLDMVGRRLDAPSLSHLFGTDSLGRDVFSRTMAGASYSIPIATVVVAAGALF